MKKIVIISPRQKYGGAIVLHALNECLNNLGYDSKIFYTDIYDIGNKGIISELKFLLRYMKYCVKDFFVERKKKYYKPFHKINRKYFPFVGKNTLVVYPEKVYGNPLHAKNIVRWFLYYYKYSEDKNAYGKNDLFICYREQFNDWKLNPNGYKLQTSYFDLNLYRRTNYGNREGKCYIIRKGKNRKDLPQKFDGIVIDNLSEQMKVEIFNKCEICISYDTQTAYSAIAALCGCLSVVMPENGKSRKDYLSNGEKEYGVAYGFSDEEIKYAKRTACLIQKSYENRNSTCRKQTELFVDLCKQKFDNSRGVK